MTTDCNMSPQGPPAPDLGAIRARLMSYPRVTMYDDDVQALVAAYDRQTELLETVLLKHQDAAARLAAVEAERDRAVRDVQLMQGSFAAVVAERDEARQRATRLAALEQAARAWRHTKSEAAWEALGDALVALDVPPPEQL